MSNTPAGKPSQQGGHLSVDNQYPFIGESTYQSDFKPYKVVLLPNSRNNQNDPYKHNESKLTGSNLDDNYRRPLCQQYQNYNNNFNRVNPSNMDRNTVNNYHQSPYLYDNGLDYHNLHNPSNISNRNYNLPAYTNYIEPLNNRPNNNINNQYYLPSNRPSDNYFTRNVLNDSSNQTYYNRYNNIDNYKLNQNHNYNFPYNKIDYDDHHYQRNNLQRSPPTSHDYGNQQNIHYHQLRSKPSHPQEYVQAYEQLGSFYQSPDSSKSKVKQTNKSGSSSSLLYRQNLRDQSQKEFQEKVKQDKLHHKKQSFPHVEIYTISNDKNDKKVSTSDLSNGDNNVSLENTRKKRKRNPIKPKETATSKVDQIKNAKIDDHPEGQYKDLIKEIQRLNLNLNSSSTQTEFPYFLPNQCNYPLFYGMNVNNMIDPLSYDSVLNNQNNHTNLPPQFPAQNNYTNNVNNNNMNKMSNNNNFSNMSNINHHSESPQKNPLLIRSDDIKNADMEKIDIDTFLKNQGISNYNSDILRSDDEMHYNDNINIENFHFDNIEIHSDDPNKNIISDNEDNINTDNNGHINTTNEPEQNNNSNDVFQQPGDSLSNDIPHESPKLTNLSEQEPIVPNFQKDQIHFDDNSSRDMDNDVDQHKQSTDIPAEEYGGYSNRNRDRSSLTTSYIDSINFVPNHISGEAPANLNINLRINDVILRIRTADVNRTNNIGMKNDGNLLTNCNSNTQYQNTDLSNAYNDQINNNRSDPSDFDTE